MAEFYTNLPQQDQQALDKTIDQLQNKAYQDEYEFNAGEYDAAIAFFVKRGFNRASAESTAYVMLAQAKIDNVKVFELLDTLKGLDGTQLSYIVTEVLNNNRVNTSSLGYKVESPSDLSEKRNIVV